MKTNLKFILLIVTMFGLFGGVATAQPAALSAASGS